MEQHAINQDLWRAASEETRALWAEHHEFLTGAFGLFTPVCRTPEVAGSAVAGADGAEYWVTSFRDEDGEVHHEIGTRNPAPRPVPGQREAMPDGGLTLPREPVQAEVRLGLDSTGKRRMVRICCIGRKCHNMYWMLK